MQTQEIIKSYNEAKESRSNWENLWQECYDYALPQRNNSSSLSKGQQRTNYIFDATAMDSVDQLAASLLGNLTPPWSQWFGFKPGSEISQEQAESLSPILENAAKSMHSHFDKSNFAIEMHQCFLDLIVAGTACLYFEEAEPGSFSAFRFKAIPLNTIVMKEGNSNLLDNSFRTSKLTLEQIQARWPYANIEDSYFKKSEKDMDLKYEVMESVTALEQGYQYTAFINEDKKEKIILNDMRLNHTPFINFRWMKSPGEIYGRSPVMKALPDIKTANKVVELILKNASIAVTGIWQADDDGVLNPANIELKPGTIIPKAVGSQGLKPLEMPGNFDLSQLVLQDLRSRIRHSLLTDKLGQISDRTMTATEVLERSAEMALLLGAIYGRLQTELLTPLVKRAFAILKRRGEIPNVNLDGRLVELDYRSPLARAQGQRNVQNILFWLQTVQAMGTEAIETVDMAGTARYLGDALGVPSDLIKNDITTINL